MLMIMSFSIGFLSAFAIRLNKKDKIIFVKNIDSSTVMENV